MSMKIKYVFELIQSIDLILVFVTVDSVKALRDSTPQFIVPLVSSLAICNLHFVRVTHEHIVHRANGVLGLGDEFEPPPIQLTGPVLVVLVVLSMIEDTHDKLGLEGTCINVLHKLLKRHVIATPQVLTSRIQDIGIELTDRHLRCWGSERS
jgi:hypothetical protein